MYYKYIQVIIHQRKGKGKMSEPIIISRKAIARITEVASQNSITKILRNAGFYDVIEASEQEDIPKILETLKFLPDDPDISYVVAILEGPDGHAPNEQE